MAKPTRVFFVSDLHGSERCFRKFVNAGRVYEAQVLLIGGDIAGKTITPLYPEKGGWSGLYLGSRRWVQTAADLDRFEEDLRATGSIPYRTSPAEWAEISEDRRRADELFRKLALEVLRRWISFAESRLHGSGIRMLIGLGNDDLDEMEGVLSESKYVELTDGHVLHLDDRHELLTLPYSNITPWHTNRELSELEIAERLRKAVKQLEHPEHTVFNIHVPPHGTPLDLAPRLTPDLTKVMGPGGEPELVHVGSSAVRAAIETYRPLLGLHGHIHESKGFTQLDRTLCINPGSIYQEGVLQGLVVDLDFDGVRSHVLTTG
ncbi:MAG: metallophosphoesterase [Thermoplasmata archaeon]|nr:metallophosphoesterase [Thermoplasmata archaeon]